MGWKTFWYDVQYLTHLGRKLGILIIVTFLPITDNKYS